MIARRIADHLYVIPLGFVNAFLVAYQELTLIDTGVAGSDKKILAAIEELGFRPHDLRHILITHLHYDHTGSLGEMKRASGARVYMHEIDAVSFSNGDVMRAVEPSPGWISRLIVTKINRNQQQSSGKNTLVDDFIANDDTLEATAGIRPIHTPGHTAGHIAYYLPQQGGVLFVGDAASNFLHLGYSILYEDFSQGQKSLEAISQRDFEIACFSHGKIIQSGASQKFSERFKTLKPS